MAIYKWSLPNISKIGRSNVLSIHFTYGDKKEAVSVMREATQWLIDIGKPLWDIDDLLTENISNPNEQYYVLWDGKESIAAMILCFEDKFFWPHRAGLLKFYETCGFTLVEIKRLNTAEFGLIDLAMYEMKLS